ncbi:MAG: serine/threonine protein kinase [Thermoanaerobaculia bacterium]
MAPTELICLRCKTQLDPRAEACPSCSEKVTDFQRTYSTRLIDGKYQILDRLGVGGMGEIFKVRHIHLGEQRVIKIMRANIAADEQALQRFLYEARLATTVKHRSLAMLYDFSTLDDGSYYMVWEFIDGVNIQKWIASNGPVPPRLAVEIAIQALGGLGALHEMGIIHRDISPENIMLSQDQRGKLLVKVIDFGIAKQLSEGEGGQGLTQTGMFLGKLKYASPEQAGFIKEGEHLDARSDLYSFGIVLYEMLAGRTPFLATNPHGYILKHATEKPLSFSEINPDVKVPASLESIVLKVLEKDRESRHHDTTALIEDLQSVRASIQPESKYGLGERMITLSATPTLVDGKPFAGTGSTRQTSVTSADAAPTVIESGAAPTVVERTAGGAPTAFGSGDAAAVPTMIDSLGASAAPTRVEPKLGSSAAATVFERITSPAAGRRKPAIWIGAAAAALVLVIIGGVMFSRSGTSTDSATGTSMASITGVTPLTSTAPGDRTSVLLLTGSPGLEIQGLQHLESEQPVQLSEDDRIVPVRVSNLIAGTYEVTLRDRAGRPVTRRIQVDSGAPATYHADISSPVDLDQVVEDILRQ